MRPVRLTHEGSPRAVDHPQEGRLHGSGRDVRRRSTDDSRTHRRSHVGLIVRRLAVSNKALSLTEAVKRLKGPVGTAVEVQFGGEKGPVVNFRPGDIVVIPAANAMVGTSNMAKTRVTECLVIISFLSKWFSSVSIQQECHATVGSRQWSTPAPWSDSHRWRRTA